MPASDDRLAALLPGFQSGTLSGSAPETLEFNRLARPIFKKFAKRLGPDLQTDIVNCDVVSECFVVLLEREAGAFDPRRGSVRKYLFGIARTAIQRVRAQYCPPGRRTRYRSHPVSMQCPLCERDLRKSRVCSQCKVGIPESAELVTNPDYRIEPFDEELHGDARHQVAEFIIANARLDAAKAIQTASTLVLAVLIGVYVKGETLQAIARRLKVSRFRLNRELKAFQEEARNSYAAYDNRQGVA
jgi:DNA-directed RNA polymerase specialized sigma24 family protein